MPAAADPPSTPEPFQPSPLFPTAAPDARIGAPAEGVRQAQVGGEVPLAKPMEAVEGRVKKRREVAFPHEPKLVEKPLWEVPGEATGRAWIGVVMMLVVLALYSWMLGRYYAGAHGGVDQAGYLMTARLIAGEMNPDAPERPAGVERVLGASTTPAATAPAVAASTPATGPAGRPAGISIWPGSDVAGYTNGEVPDGRGEHPAPASIQVRPGWDWLRNRLSFVPESPFQFASRMCIITEPFGPAVAEVAGVPTASRPNGEGIIPAKPGLPEKPAEYRVFAKYPFGFPLIAAIGREMAKPLDHTTVAHTEVKEIDGKVEKRVVKEPAVGKGLDGMYIVNPLCTVMACFFAYFLYRQAVSPFVALIGVLSLAFNPVVLNYANDANSHASTLFCVCAGFWGVMSYVRTGQIWRAWVGGFMLGYACTIRYSEFLLLLPVLFAAAITFRRNWKWAMGSLSLLVAWAIPVMVLALVCWVSFGSPTKTGYTYCNEDTGFGWKYLSGDWGDRTLVGNWETLVTQVNRTGMFLLWPLALAGLFGMLGTAWRLGGLIVLWVVPSLVLYMLYYWAPGGEVATGYLRFFASIVPGLILAAMWMLEKGLTAVRAEKRAALIVATVFGVGLLLAIAFYADGGPTVIDGGLRKTVAGFVVQTPAALWHLLTGSKLGALCFVVVVLGIAGMWLIDREIIGRRLGLALGAGVITALGCTVNLYTILPQLDAAYGRWMVLRQVVDNLREVLPRGSVVFCDDALLNQLDCVGGWKLYNTPLFKPGMYAESKIRVDQRNNLERIDDPDPIQPERSRFYMELLSQPSTVSRISLGSRNPNDLLLMQKAVIDRELEKGHKVTFLMLTDMGDMAGAGGGGGRNMALPPGYETKVLRKWTVSPMPTVAVTAPAAVFGPRNGPAGRGGGGRGLGAAVRGMGGGAIVPLPPAVSGPVPPKGATYVLYEVVRAK